MTTEKRRNSRTKSLNLINYMHSDESGDEGHQGMGRTLNVSRTGILLETYSAVDVGHNILLTIGLNENVIEIKGLVKYSKSTQDGKYESGIEFIDVSIAAQSILDDYIAAFLSSANPKEQGQ